MNLINEIPVFDITAEVDELWPQLMDVMCKVLRSGRFIMGPNVTSFEHEVAAYLGVKHTIAVNSGTDALVIALKAAGIGEGDEVITTPFTFFATAEAISQVSAKPVFVDVNLQTYNVDIEAVEAALTNKTKAILPVHIFGYPCDMTALSELTQDNNLLLVEDCAQSFGASYNGVKTGTIGNAGCFSFYPSKNLGAYGDGGLICTNHDNLALTAASLRVHGSHTKYRNEMVGYNSRLDELQAAMLRVKLPYVDQWNKRRQEIARRYTQQLADCEGIVTPWESNDRMHVFHQYTIRVLHGRRDKLRQALSERGIHTMVYYPVPIHKLPVYTEKITPLPNSELLATEVLSLPMWPNLAREQQDHIVNSIREVILKF